MGLPTSNSATKRKTSSSNTVALFKNNFEHGDIYFGLVESDDKTLYKGRLTIYLYKNPKKDGLPTKPYGEEGELLYIVDLKDCILVYDEFESIERKISASEDGSRMPANALSARDTACIALKVPSSDKDWLNQLIEQSLSVYS